MNSKEVSRVIKVALTVAIGTQIATGSTPLRLFGRFSEAQLTRMALNDSIQTTGACDQDNPPSATGECQIADPVDQ